MNEESSATSELASPSPVEDAGAESTPAPPRSNPTSTSPGSSVAFVARGHEVLFRDDATDRCDVCGERVEEDSGEGPAVPGRALYVWARGEAVRYEEPPLCPACGAALALSALGRWEIEEEEG